MIRSQGGGAGSERRTAVVPEVRLCTWRILSVSTSKCLPDSRFDLHSEGVGWDVLVESSSRGTNPRLIHGSSPKPGAIPVTYDHHKTMSEHGTKCIQEHIVDAAVVRT